MNSKHYYCLAIAALLALTLSTTASATTLTWTGGTSQVWDLYTTDVNWTPAPFYYDNTNDVVFDATGSGGTIQVGPGIEPVSTTVAGGSYAFQNAVDNSGYTISGAGGSLGTFAVTGGAANVSGADINCNVTVSGGA